MHVRLALLAAVLGISACAPVSPYGATYGAPLAGQPASQVAGTFCAAGFYQCQLAQVGPIGAPCACPGLGAPSYGVIR